MVATTSSRAHNTPDCIVWKRQIVGMFLEILLHCLWLFDRPIKYHLTSSRERNLSRKCTVLSYILEFIYIVQIAKTRISPVIVFNMQIPDQVECLVVFACWKQIQDLCAYLCYLYNIDILYRYFIATCMRDIYQNICPEVPGNPRDVIFPDAEGGGTYNISGIPGNLGTNILVNFPHSNEFGVGKYNISGIPGNLGTNILVYFPHSNENCYVTFYSWKRLKNRSESLGAT